MADPSGNVGKNTYMSYDVYLNMRRSVQYYNLGLKAQALNTTAGWEDAAFNYFMALGLNPYDVDSKAALLFITSPNPTPPPSAISEDQCRTAKQLANAELKKCGFCRR